MHTRGGVSIFASRENADARATFPAEDCLAGLGERPKEGRAGKRAKGRGGEPGRIDASSRE